MTSTMTAPATPVLGKIVRHAGIAGQLAYSVSVSYDDGPASVVTFVGSTYGPGVVMVLGPRAVDQFRVDSDVNARCGTFGPEWVRRFFADAR